MSGLFAGFDLLDVDLGDVRLKGRTGGSGEPVLLLHGFPQTHCHWHALAPLLAEHYTVIAPDLPGYGESVGEAPDDTHLAYSKRRMAAHMVCLMAQLGHDKFHLVGHDRGARVAYRLTLDHPEKVGKLVSFDTGPTLDIWEAMDWHAAIDAFHWPLLAQPHPVPETFIGADPAFFLDHLIDQWIGSDRTLNQKALAEYARCIAKPSVIRAMCEDYRAGATIDVEHDLSDRNAGVRITVPLLVIRGAGYQPEALAPIWTKWADDVTEEALDCGHFIAEERPEEGADLIVRFLGR